MTTDRRPASLVIALVCVLAVAGLVAGFLLDDDEAPSPVSSGSTASRSAADLAFDSHLRVDRIARYAGPTYRLRGHSATARAETKVWWAAGSWWAVLLEPDQRVHIARWTGRGWTTGGPVVDTRARSTADVVWTGTRLYVASRLSNGQLQLRRFRLVGGTWRPLEALPRVIALGGSTSLSIDVDSRDRVWAVFNSRGRMWITHSSPQGLAFAPPTGLPGPDTVKPDDLGAVVAVAGQIAVLWSDQVRGAFRFAIRADRDPVAVLRLATAPLAGVRIADGHIRLLATKDGRILAAVKTSLGDADTDPPRSPLLDLLERSPAGQWTRHTVATTADQMTRPQLVLSADENDLYLLATAPQAGGAIYLKVADAHTLAFGQGRGTLVLGAAGDVINNATVGRNPVSASTGLLVLASDAGRAGYQTAVLTLRRP
jgi:hypothetical protein